MPRRQCLERPHHDAHVFELTACPLLDSEPEIRRLAVCRGTNPLSVPLPFSPLLRFPTLYKAYIMLPSVAQFAPMQTVPFKEEMTRIEQIPVAPRHSQMPALILKWPLKNSR